MLSWPLFKTMVSRDFWMDRYLYRSFDRRFGLIVFSFFLPKPLRYFCLLLHDLHCFDIWCSYLILFFVLVYLFSIWQSDSDVVSLVFCALESIHAALAVMAHNNMPKQLYKEEVLFFFFNWQCFIIVLSVLYFLLLKNFSDYSPWWLIMLLPYQIIERILEFSKHQILDVMSAYDPSYRALHKPSENGAPEGRLYTLI